MAGGFLLPSSGPNLLVWVTVDGPERVANESSAEARRCALFQMSDSGCTMRETIE